MSKIEVNAIEPQSGTTLTVGASGDTIVIPSGATISNQGTAAGFGPTGAVSWNTTKITANPNPAVTGVGYFCDTTSAAFTVTLPATPAAGAVIGIADYANTFATNNLTVGRNGSNIGGVATNAILSTNGLSVTFVYVDATQGWIVTDSGNRSDLPTPAYVAATGGCVATCGNYKIHTFTGPGTFTVTSAGNPGGSSTVDYMVIAGGGAGGGFYYGGGGGAGGFRESVPSPAAWTASPLANPGGALPVSVQGYPITVGGGGTVAGTVQGNLGTSGNNSIFSTITSAGGGRGGTSCGPSVPTPSPGANGGSGGGAGGCGGAGPSPVGTGGVGNTPPTSPPQGSTGGIAIKNTGTGAGGGGGGATSVGGNAPTPDTAGNGGTGAGTAINLSPTVGTPGPSPSLRYYAGGGGGGVYASSNRGTGGTGGGGAGGSNSPSVAPTNGTANTGGGAGGRGKDDAICNSGSGGSGIVVIRYKFQ